MTQKTVPGVSIAIPTYNRSELLAMSLQSALDQSYADLEVLVLDNASTDDTPAVVDRLSDSRVRYVRNSENIGLFRNWNRAIGLNRSPYLVILQDDDVLLPEIVKQSVDALSASPGAGFSFAKASGIGMNNEPCPLPGEFPEGGVISGLELLHRFVAGSNWIIRPSTVMMRASALEKVGPFDSVHSRLSIDLNLYLRMAAHFDVAFVPKVLARNRVHGGQQTQQSFRSPGGTGPLATLAERTDAIAHLLRSTRAEDPGYRLWLADRLMHLNLRRSEMTSKYAPDLNLSWEEKMQILKEEIAALVPDGARFVLIDNDEFGDDLVSGRQAVPLVQREGRSWGPPPDDATAVQELEKLHRAGVNYVLIAWPAFWWLDYYGGLREHLQSGYTCVISNSRLVGYVLEGQRQAQAGVANNPGTWQDGPRQ
jgi:glycosyltransferase involved in cell wall biosynthesis